MRKGRPNMEHRPMVALLGYLILWTGIPAHAAPQRRMLQDTSPPPSPSTSPPSPSPPLASPSPPSPPSPPTVPPSPASPPPASPTSPPPVAIPPVAMSAAVTGLALPPPPKSPPSPPPAPAAPPANTGPASWITGLFMLPMTLIGLFFIPAIAVISIIEQTPLYTNAGLAYAAGDLAKAQLLMDRSEYEKGVYLQSALANLTDNVKYFSFITKPFVDTFLGGVNTHVVAWGEAGAWFGNGENDGTYPFLLTQLQKFTTPPPAAPVATPAATTMPTSKKAWNPSING